MDADDDDFKMLMSNSEFADFIMTGKVNTADNIEVITLSDDETEVHHTASTRGSGTKRPNDVAQRANNSKVLGTSASSKTSVSRSCQRKTQSQAFQAAQKRPVTKAAKVVSSAPPTTTASNLATRTSTSTLFPGFNFANAKRQRKQEPYFGVDKEWDQLLLTQTVIGTTVSKSGRKCKAKQYF